MSTIVQIAVFIALVGATALITYLIRHNAEEKDEPYMDWMDYEKWRNNK